MRRLIQKDWFWWVGSVAIAGIASFVIIFSIQLYEKYVIKHLHTVLGNSILLPVGISLSVCLATAYFSWRLVIGSRQEITVKASFRTGVFAIILAHFVFAVFRFLYFLILGNGRDAELIEIALAALVSIAGAAIGLVLFGWLTLPLGGIIAALLGWLYTRSHPLLETT